MDECPLKGLLTQRADRVYRFLVPRIQTCIVHAGRQGARRGMKVLDLLRDKTAIAKVLRQLDSGLKVCTGVA